MSSAISHSTVANTPPNEICNWAQENPLIATVSAVALAVLGITAAGGVFTTASAPLTVLLGLASVLGTGLSIAFSLILMQPLPASTTSSSRP